MTYENLGGSALDYLSCRYGTSKVLFRGPRRRLDAPYIAVIGGTETYGKFIKQPYPALLEERLGSTFVNLGCVNAGLDVMVNDPTISEICAGAKLTVIQITSAQNMSNRFYSVHPRRNDRFLRASNLLKIIYREVDFTDINFTRHMLKVLWEASPDKFAMVEAELREAWLGRMKGLISRLEGRVVLLWLADHAPDDAPKYAPDAADPLFIDADMIEELRPQVAGLAQVVVSRQEIADGQADLLYDEMEAPAARASLGVVAQRRAADALEEVLAELP